MKAFLFVAIFVVYAFAQGDEGGGCCFYSDQHFKDQIVCTSQAVKNTKPIRSWFCTDGYAANLVKQKAILAPVLCGDTLPETSRPVDADEIHVFSPCPRFSDCCFYTEENNQGEEVCIPGPAPAAGKQFKSFQCLPGWRPKVKGGKDIPCPRPGVAVSFGGNVKHGDLETVACEIPAAEPVAETVFEAGAAFSDLENEFNADASAALGEEQFVAEDNFFASEDSFALGAEDVAFASEDAAFATEDAAFATEDVAFDTEEAAFAFEDAAFATVEEANFVEVAEGDLAMANGEETVVQQSGASFVASTVACLLVVISFLLA